MSEVLKSRYLLGACLGQSLFAGTYVAQDQQTGQEVILKELNLSATSTWKNLELFQREARVLRGLSHPGIPRLLDAFEGESDTGPVFYLVQQKISGENLRQKAAGGWKPDEAEARDIAFQVLHILDYLQSFSPPIVHRDLKPSNLMLDDNGRVWLIDFGAVQDLLRPQGSSTVVGTFGYMAPEQFTGQAVPASDLYALGATLVHLLTGIPPAELPQRRLRLVFEDQIQLSPAFEAWLVHMIEPKLNMRFTCAADALQALAAMPSDAQQLADPSDLMLQPQLSSALSERVMSKLALSNLVLLPLALWASFMINHVSVLVFLLLFLAFGFGSSAIVGTVCWFYYRNKHPESPDIQLTVHQIRIQNFFLPCHLLLKADAVLTSTPGIHFGINELALCWQDSIGTVTQTQAESPRLLERAMKDDVPGLHYNSFHLKLSADENHQIAGQINTWIQAHQAEILAASRQHPEKALAGLAPPPESGIHLSAQKGTLSIQIDQAEALLELRPDTLLCNTPALKVQVRRHDIKRLEISTETTPDSGGKRRLLLIHASKGQVYRLVPTSQSFQLHELVWLKDILSRWLSL